jgi:hypothetical protein
MVVLVAVGLGAASCAFDGSRPLPSVEGTLAALAAAADHGLDPADYDAAVLGGQWHLVGVTSAPAADRALVDVGLSVTGDGLAIDPVSPVHGRGIGPPAEHGPEQAGAPSSRTSPGRADVPRGPARLVSRRAGSLKFLATDAVTFLTRLHRAGDRLDTEG